VPTTARLAIPDASRRRVLVLPRDSGWALPSFTTAWPPRWSEALEVITPALGFAPVLVRVAEFVDGRGAADDDGVCLLEPPPAGWEPPHGSTWVARDELATLGLDERECAGAGGWLDQLAGAPGPPERMPWAEAGWYDATVEWIEERVAELGRSITGPITQRKHWSISSILRVPTAEGPIWCKDVPTFFAQEGPVLEVLCRTTPGPLPVVLARADGRVLLEDLGGASLEAFDAPVEDHERAARLLATMQLEWIDRVDELLAAGAVDRRLALLPAHAAAIAARPDVTGGLDAERRSRLDALVAALPERCAALADSDGGVPATLVHGDFHPGNVAKRPDGSLVVFDWTDVAVGHPFVDLAPYRPHRDAVIAAYAGVWRERVGNEAVDRALELIPPIAALHHGVSYARLLDGVEPDERYEFDDEPLGWAHTALVSSDHGGWPIYSVP
jgi:hypothetical protein